MDVNMSLDDIIRRSGNKRNQGVNKWKNDKPTSMIKGILKQPGKFGRPNPKPVGAFNKNERRKPAFSQAAGFGIRARIGIPDARLKIIQNIKKTVQKGITPDRQPLDARMKIEAQKQKQIPKTPKLPIFDLNELPAITRLNEGMLQRSVGTTVRDKNYIVMEECDDDEEEEEEEDYEEDENMDVDDIVPITRTISNSPDMLNPENFQSLRRTVTNETAKKKVKVGAIRSNGSLHFRSSNNVPARNQLMDVTRTIDNEIRKKSTTTKRSSLNNSKRLENGKSPMARLGKKANEEQGCYRVLISNLHSNVTSEDIKELFEDVGTLITARIVRTGTAEAIYKYQEDASNAVEVYHNRQLDGLPMKCSFVKSSRITSDRISSNKNNTSSKSNIPTKTTSASIQPDAVTIRKALFSK